MIAAILLILIAGFRPVGIDGDSLSYVEFISNFSQEHNYFNKEPAFIFIVYINELIFGGNTQSFFFAFALIGVSINLFAIRRISLYPIFSLFVYIALFFVLHEMTQIRAGVASAIFLLSIQNLVNRERKQYFIKCFIAFMFHFSSLVMIPIYFINPKKFNKNFYIILPFLGLLLFQFLSFSMLIRVLSSIPSDSIVSVLSAYEYVYYLGDQPQAKLLNAFYISNLVFYFILVFRVRRLDSNFAVACTKVMGYSLFSLPAFFAFPVFAFRLSEFLNVVLILMIPHSIDLFKQRRTATALLGLWLFTYFLFIMVGKNLTII